ncbi:hypothetical protein [Listeria monocytogenes]|uniref:hypothetical protein n=1 Tax=Listeria monocytogenes TaxID=1639 RepID=UPI00159F6280|nr:hypothetical protein [Listeria monocytogenes]EKZ4589108.1 hypothetical protein [Listeria monocytogenes]
MNDFIENTVQNYVKEQYHQKSEEQLDELVAMFAHGFKLGMQIAFDAIVTKEEGKENGI